MPNWLGGLLALGAIAGFIGFAFFKAPRASGQSAMTHSTGVAPTLQMAVDQTTAQMVMPEGGNRWFCAFAILRLDRNIGLPQNSTTKVLRLQHHPAGKHGTRSAL